MSDIFVSYSRKDEDFAKRLHRELINKSKDIWIDFESIPKGENFLQEIFEGIEKADIFCVIISRHSLMSEICNLEIEHAIKTGKRILPVIREKIEGDVLKIIKGHWTDIEWAGMAKANWDTLKPKQWTFFDNDSLFDSEFEKFIKAMEQDISYVRQHTQLGVRAKVWSEEQERNASWLLFGDEIVYWEKWLVNWDNLPEGKQPDPSPTDLQREYVVISRDAEDKRQLVYQEYLSINDRVNKRISDAEQYKRNTMIWIEEQKAKSEKSYIWIEEQKVELEKRQKNIETEFENNNIWIEEQKTEIEKKHKKVEEQSAEFEKTQKRLEVEYQEIIKSSKRTRYLSRILLYFSSLLLIANILLLIRLIYQIIHFN